MARAVIPATLRIFLCCWVLGLAATENPFEIPFAAKSELNHDDFIQIQDLLRKINLDPLLRPMYDAHQPNTFTTYDDIKGRCSRGVQQELINPSQGRYPYRELTKIGEGGDRCVVCCAPFAVGDTDRGTRAKLASSIKEALATTGFNGYCLSLTGGYPNPTGEEIRYVGVPYAFKIFMMLEAAKLGFTNVLWIDAACLPLNDPTPLFDHLETHEALLYSFPPSYDLSRYIFHQTRQLLLELTGTDVLRSHYLVTIVFGLKMSCERVHRLVQEYYRLVAKGLPFLSCFPEEFVLVSIIGTPYFASWGAYPHLHRLFTRCAPGDTDTEEGICMARLQGYYFYQRQH